MTVSFARLTYASVAAALAVAMTGCSSDDPATSSSNRGGDEASGETTVENVFIAPAYTLACVLQVDAPAQLTFTATNQSSSETEVLTSISSPAAETITIQTANDNLDIAPESRIAVGQPVENIDNPDAPDEPVFAVMEGLTDAIQPGLSVPVTFTFERAGDLTLDVAVDACATQTN